MAHLNDLDAWGSLSSVDGDLGRPISATRWVRAREVTLTDDALDVVGLRHLGHDEDPDDWIVAPGHGMLEDFVRLADAPPEKILAFARRWGTLGLCGHARPASHGASAETDRHQPLRGCPVPPEGIEQAAYWQGLTREPLGAWRDYARKIRTVLWLAASAHGVGPDLLLPRADWDALWARDPSGPEPETWRMMARDLEGEAAQIGRRGARAILALVLDRWLRETDVRPHLSLYAGTGIQLGGHGLAGAIAVAAILAVSRTDGLAVCSACGVPFVPVRRPAAGRRTYCQECRDNKVPRRDASHDWNTRNPTYYREHRAQTRAAQTPPEAAS